MQVLALDFNRISRLPDLSGLTKLEKLSATNNQLTALPQLPAGLRVLSVSQNGLAVLPAQLPASLEELEAQRNVLTVGGCMDGCVGGWVQFHKEEHQNARRHSLIQVAAPV